MTTAPAEQSPTERDNKFLRNSIWAIIALVAIFLVVAHFSSPMSIKFANATAVLSIITAGAVGIERIVEMFWTLVGQTKGSWWPFNLASAKIFEMISGLDQTLKPVYDKAAETIQQLAVTEQWGEERLNAAKAELDEISKNLEWFENLAPDSQHVQLITAKAYQNISYLQAKYPDIQKNAAVAGQAITGISDFVATFKDNPGRRMVSLVIGAFLGMVFAGIAGLDVFRAAGDITLAPGTQSLFPNIGIALTGLLIGLGSNPTHEAIRILQEIKASRKLDNTPVPEAMADAGAQPISYAKFTLKGK